MHIPLTILSLLSNGYSFPHQLTPLDLLPEYCTQYLHASFNTFLGLHLRSKMFTKLVRANLKAIAATLFQAHRVTPLSQNNGNLDVFIR